MCFTSPPGPPGSFLLCRGGDQSSRGWGALLATGWGRAGPRPGRAGAELGGTEQKWGRAGAELDGAGQKWGRDGQRWGRAGKRWGRAGAELGGTGQKWGRVGAEMGQSWTELGHSWAELGRDGREGRAGQSPGVGAQLRVRAQELRAEAIRHQGRMALRGT